MGLAGLNGGVETFGKANRFKSPKRSEGYIESVPHGYQSVESKIGKIQQCKTIPECTEETQRVYEKSENRTFFGFPAKCEGPGPAAHNPENSLAFRSISHCDEILNNK